MLAGSEEPGEDQGSQWPQFDFVDLRFVSNPESQGYGAKLVRKRPGRTRTGILKLGVWRSFRFEKSDPLLHGT